MNAGIRAVVRAAIYHGIAVSGIYRGYQGLMDGDIQPLTARSVSAIINRGGTILRTARCKAFLEPEGRAQAAAQLRKHGIDALVAIGGDGTYRGAQKLYEEHSVRCIGMPGTIDNDIGGTDYTIGFDTALNTAVEAIDRLRDTASSHDRLFFVEVMGRHSGYLSVISGIACGAEEILVPETPTQVEQLVASLQQARANGKQSMIVVVAEGDDAGHAIQIASRVMEISDFKDTRVTVIGHLQRGGTPSAFDRVLASRMGIRAVEALLEGETGKMVGISGSYLVLRPFAEAWECRTQFDNSLLRVQRILSI